MRVLTCVKLSFAAAHSISSRLSDKCAVIHGHNYNVELCFTSENPLPWVCDFGKLKEIARRVIDRLDHKYLLPEEICREVKIEIPGISPSVMCLPVREVTSEELAIYIAREISNELAKELPNVRLVRVKLYESDTSFVEVELL